MKKKFEIKKSYLFLGIIVLFVFGIFLFFRIQEDSWVRDYRGVYVKHGNPSEAPDSVLEQQAVIKCAFGLYKIVSEQGIELSSQCIGTCGDFAVDIVHVPRNSEDELEENQCLEYNLGNVSHFIELDKNGNIVRII